jgi:hypothetical protein
MEIWKNIEGYNGLYQVSNKGKVKRVRTESIDKKNRLRIKNEVILKGAPASHGRLMVGLSKNGMVKTFLVYRLMAMAFIPNPYNKKTINHINGDYTDNSLSNLEWATHSENLKHAWDNNLR